MNEIMKRVTVIANKSQVAIVICAMLASGCATEDMQLRSLRRDIPTTLVAHYNDSGEAYVDERNIFFLPLLLSEDGFVSKTADGFQAQTENSFLFGLLLWLDESSEYDSAGRLLEYEGNASLLTLVSQRVEIHRDNGVLNEGGGWSILWGAFGFREKPTGERTAIVLWIPVPAGQAARPAMAQNSSCDATNATKTLPHKTIKPY